MSPKYRVDSCGSRSTSARSTVNPPRPESKTPMGRSSRGWPLHRCFPHRHARHASGATRRDGADPPPRARCRSLLAAPRPRHRGREHRPGGAPRRGPGRTRPRRRVWPSVTVPGGRAQDGSREREHTDPLPGADEGRDPVGRRVGRDDLDPRARCVVRREGARRARGSSDAAAPCPTAASCSPSPRPAAARAVGSVVQSTIVDSTPTEHAPPSSTTGTRRRARRAPRRPSSGSPGRSDSRTAPRAPPPNAVEQLDARAGDPGPGGRRCPGLR